MDSPSLKFTRLHCFEAEGFATSMGNGGNAQVAVTLVVERSIQSFEVCTVDSPIPTESHSRIKRRCTEEDGRLQLVGVPCSSTPERNNSAEGYPRSPQVGVGQLVLDEDSFLKELMVIFAPDPTWSSLFQVGHSSMERLSS